MTFADLNKTINVTIQAKLTAGTLKTNSVAFITAINVILTNVNATSPLINVVTNNINNKMPTTRNVRWWINMIRNAMLVIVKLGQEQDAVNAYTAAFGS
jgi:hypothetical protein